MGEDRAFAGAVAGARAQKFRGVRLHAAGLARVVAPRRLENHELRRLELGPALRKRVLDRLVRADGAPENDPLAGIARRPPERRAADADALRPDKNALGVEAVQQIAEALALLADPVFSGNPEAVDEQFVRVDRVAAHLDDLARRHRAAVEVGIEQTQAVRGLRAVLHGRRAREDQHLVGDLRGRRPDLAPVDNVAVTLRPRAGLHPRRVEAGVGLGHREAGFLAALDQRRQKPPPLLLRAEGDDGERAENVHVDGRTAAHRRARLGDGAHHQRRFGDPQAGAADLRRHGDAEPAGLGDRGVKFVWERMSAFAFAPPGGVEAATDARNRLDDTLPFLREGNAHARRCLSDAELRQ